MMREKRQVKVTPCACCGKPSEVDVWQYVLCVRCHGRWVVEVGPPPPTNGAHTCGKFDEHGQFVKTGEPEKCPACIPWRRATQDWLQKARAA